MLKQTRLAKVTGSVIGVTIGCLLGMAPLLFLHTREDEPATTSAVTEPQVADVLPGTAG